MNTPKPKAKSTTSKTIVNNRRAFHEYHVLETFMVGLVLQGTEVKSLRAGKASVNEAYARIEKGELWLYQLNISPYEQGSYNNHVADRPRKLLMEKKEIRKLYATIKEKGYTLIPLKIFFNRCWVKVSLGLCQGKKLYDKRETLKARDSQREMDRAKKWQG